MAGIYDERIIGAKQQAETARKLREGITAPEGKMVSGWYVPPSITQYMANALKSYGAGKEEREAKSEYERMQKQKQTETADILRQLEPQASVQVSPEMANAAYGQGDINSVMANPTPQTQTTYQPVDERTRMAALLRGAAVNPEAFQPQMQMAQWDIGRQDKKEATQQAEALRREQWTRDESLRRDLANQSSTDRRFIAQMANDNRPEPLVSVMGANNQPILLPRSQAAGMTPFNAQIQKQNQADSAAQNGARRALETVGYDPNTGNDRVSKLISQSTGSGIGSLADKAAGAVGYATEGAKATGQLEAMAKQITLDRLSGKLGAGISNADVMMLDKALGDIANPGTPNDVKMEAWNQAKRILEQSAGYRQVGDGNAAAQPSAVIPQQSGGVRRFNPATGMLE